MGDQKDEEIKALRHQVERLTKEVESIGNHESLFPRLGPEGNTLVKVPSITSGEEYEEWMKGRKAIPTPAVKNPAAAPQPRPEETAAVLKERDESRDPVALAKSAENAMEFTRFGLGIFYTQAPDLVQRVPQQPPTPTQVLKVQVDDLLSEQALALGAKEIRSTLHVFEEDGNRYVVPCEYASKVVDLDPDGALPEAYVRRWANFLNDMAARGIWKYGCLQRCSLIEIATMDPAQRRGILISFIFINREFYKPGMSAVEALANLNKTVGSDVFRPEGDAGTADWSPEAFPW